MVAAMAHDEMARDPDSPLSDLAFDWINLVKNKAEALLAYDKYIEDAEAADSKECVALLKKLHDADSRHLAEAKEHLRHVLNGTMGDTRDRADER